MEITVEDGRTILCLLEHCRSEGLGSNGDGTLARRIIKEFPDIEVPSILGEEIHKPLCLGSRLHVKEGSIITSTLRRYMTGGEYPVPQGQCSHCGLLYGLEEDAITFLLTDRVEEHYQIEYAIMP